MSLRDTLARGIAAIPQGIQGALRPLFNALADRYASCALSSAGLVIKAGGSALAKTGASVFYAVANGKIVTIAGATDMPALVGTITANKFNVFCFFIDKAGTVTAAMGVEGATLAAVKFPPFPEGKALVGFIAVTHSSTFTGGTTPLDTATTVYVSPLGAFDPQMVP